ncbi:unconventional myosin-XIX-like [Diadema antillarum]|uniref:unconventional myosin-XIX-like n=1 Tax=Diadema antillarum TaxID=105358 RepID=UPI003A83A6BB
MRVWVADTRTDSQEAWQGTTIAGPAKNGKVPVCLENGEVRDIPIIKEDVLLLRGSNNYLEVDDLTQLSPLNEAEVLESLRHRFLNSHVCSKAGITLVSLNPFKEIPGLYEDEVIQSYHQQSNSQNGSPHVFAIAEKAFSSLRYALGCPNQSIVVSGESGAGKTWNTRCLMKYLTSVALYKNPGGFSPPPVKCIERRILDSNPILEAFGNAGTPRNHNSSRFGKYIQLQFDRGSHVIGASIQTYLLEKTRVVHQATGETNFHIFYQLINDSTSDQKSDWGLTTPTGDDVTFAYLPVEEMEHGVTNENQVFAKTQSAMKSVGLNHLHQDNIFQVLSGILHLGNLEFTCEEECDPCELDEEECGHALEQACHLLGLDRDGLLTALTFRRITASHSKRQSVFMKPCSVEEAGVRRDCMSKVIYARLFDWLVAFLNKHTSANQWHSFIGLLDIYGFESFQSNSLEQLCINYANEKLQQHFVTHFLRSAQEEYEKEGISWTFCNFSDNQPCVETIEGKLSVFSLMNEECRLNRQSDMTSFETKLLAAVESPYLSKAPLGHPHPAFTIRHYAGNVTYNVYGLIEKTKDPIPLELVEVLQGSTSPFLSKIMGPELARIQDLQNKSNKSSMSKTVVSRFKESLSELMKTLTATSPHYIRCIKPNRQCQPDSFDSRFVASQLRACGVLETVAISAAGFPAKLTHASFWERYRMLVPHRDLDSTTLSLRERCRLIHRILFGEENKENESDGARGAHLGKTKIFLREGQLEYLESCRLKQLNHCAAVIQRSWRLHRALLQGQREWAATILQAGYRGWRVRQAIQVMNDAARVIQHAMLVYMIQRKKERLQERDDHMTQDLDPIVSPMRNRKSVHFAADLTTVYSPSPAQTPSPDSPVCPAQDSTWPHPSAQPRPPALVLNNLIFTENSPDFGSLSPISDCDQDIAGFTVVDVQKEGKDEEEMATGTRDEGGVVSMVTGLLKKPAVDIALIGAVTALLITGPLRWT